MDLAIKPLPDFVYALAPAPVRDASMEYARALTRLDEARAETRTAADAVTLAERQDHERAVDAARGEKATPASTATRKAREAAERAVQTVAATQQVAHERMRAMLAAIAEHRDELDAAATETVEDIRGRLMPNLDEIESDLLRLEGMRSLRRELDDPAYLTARRPTFDPRLPRRVGDPIRGALGAMRAALNVELLEQERREAAEARGQRRAA